MSLNFSYVVQVQVQENVSEETGVPYGSLPLRFRATVDSVLRISKDIPRPLPSTWTTFFPTKNLKYFCYSWTSQSDTNFSDGMFERNPKLVDAILIANAANVTMQHVDPYYRGLILKFIPITNNDGVQKFKRFIFVKMMKEKNIFDAITNKLCCWLAMSCGGACDNSRILWPNLAYCACPIITNMTVTTFRL